MAQVLGIRSTTQAVNENSLVRQVDDQISLLEPNETPLVTFLMRLKKRHPVYTFKFEWPEDDYVGRWTTIGADVTANDATDFTVPDATYFVVGDLFTLPRLVSSSVPPEVCRVSAVNTSTNHLTVVRHVGLADPPVSGNTYTSGQAVRLLGSAAPEGDTPPTSKSTALSFVSSYTQIFRTAINLSKTQVASKQYGKPQGDRKREQKKKLVEHKQKLNMSALFGIADASGVGANGQPLRTTMGLNSRISTNLVDAGGTLTGKTFEKFSRSAFRYGSAQKLLVAAPIVISAIHDWGNSKLLVKPMEKIFGVDVERIETGHGTFLLCRDWMLEDGTGFGGMALSVDIDSSEYFYLSNNGESRDTKLLEDVVKAGQDAYVDEILTEGGFGFRFEKKFAKLFNVTDYSATY